MNESNSIVASSGLAWLPFTPVILLGVVVIFAFSHPSQYARWHYASFRFRVQLCHAKYFFLVLAVKIRYYIKQIGIRFRLFYYRRQVIAEFSRMRRLGVLDDQSVQMLKLMEDFHSGMTPNDQAERREPKP